MIITLYHDGVTNVASWHVFTVARLTLMTTAGCSRDAVEMAPVHGTVTMNGQPVGNVLVVFQPEAKPGQIEAPTRPSMATADADGHYELSTKVEGDGAAVGKHTVSIAAASGEAPPPGRLPHGHTVEVTPGDNEINLELTLGQ